MSATMVLHCGGEQFDRDTVLSVPTPDYRGGDTYYPLPYGDLLGMVEDTVASRLGFTLRAEQFGLNRINRGPDGTILDAPQLFFALTYDDGQFEGNGFTIAGRTSHDKSMSAAVIGGTRVFICDNMALSGNSFRVQRKHTLNMHGDLQQMIGEGVDAAAVAHQYLNQRWEQMREVELSLDDGFSLHGIALGHDAVKPQQVTRAMESWANEFAPDEKVKDDLPQHGRTLYGFYQSLTEGAKRGAANKAMQRHVQIDKFCQQALDQLRVAATVVDLGARPAVEQPKTLGLEID